MTTRVTYQGGLRTQAVHLKSNTAILTDAPADNRGRGEAFSPSDLLAAALAACMHTIIGIQMEDGRLPRLHLAADVNKIMQSNPRKISALEVTLTAKGPGLTDIQRKLLEHAALTCPVYLSLDPAIDKRVDFVYQTE